MERKKRKKAQDPTDEKRLKEADKRRKRFSRKVETKKSSEKLKEGRAGSYQLKGMIDDPGRKGKKRSVKRAKSKQYIIPASKLKSKKVESPGTVGDKMEYQRTVGGEYVKDPNSGAAMMDWDKRSNEKMRENNPYTKYSSPAKDDASKLKSTDWKGATGQEMRAKVSKSIEDPKKGKPAKKTTIPETRAQKERRKADKVALMNPDYTLATKGKEVRKKGYRKPSKIKKKVVKETLYSKDYKGAVDPKKRSRNRKEERLKGGATKVTIEKVRKGGDKTITKSTTKIKRKKSDTFYRQEKPLSKRKKKKEKAGKMR
tara:strand:+ start:2981 stop:3922 length:942 start_codon:yes stop_codon:yes gene_type:complete